MMFQGALLPVVGYYFHWYILGGIFILIGGCVMHTVTPETSISRVYGFSIFIALGCGLCAQGGYALAAAKATSKLAMADASEFGLINTLRRPRDGSHYWIHEHCPDRLCRHCALHLW